MCACVSDCPKEANDYGTDYGLSVPPNGYSLEFTSLKATDEPPLVLWNRGSYQAASEGGGGRGRMQVNVVKPKWIMEKLSQEHSGLYTFRNVFRQVVARRKIIVAGWPVVLGKRIAVVRI